MSNEGIAETIKKENQERPEPSADHVPGVRGPDQPAKDTGSITNDSATNWSRFGNSAKRDRESNQPETKT